jgi:hypothetical protein
MIPGGVDCSLQPSYFNYNESVSYKNDYSLNSTTDAGILNKVITCSLSRREESSKHKLSDFLIVCPQGQKNIENRF